MSVRTFLLSNPAFFFRQPHRVLAAERPEEAGGSELAELRGDEAPRPSRPGRGPRPGCAGNERMSAIPAVSAVISTAAAVRDRRGAPSSP